MGNQLLNVTDVSFRSFIVNFLYWRYLKIQTKQIEIHQQGWRMVLQKLWVSQNFSRISRVSQSRFLSGYVHLAVSFFIRRCLGVSKYFEVSASQSKKSKCLGLAKKNATLAVSQSLVFTIRHPYQSQNSTFGKPGCDQRNI